MNRTDTKSCWDVLGIQRTNDIEVIKRARRRLMKRWHPDRVRSPQLKVQNNHRSAEINAAYDEAIRLAPTVDLSPFIPRAHQSPPIVFRRFAFTFATDRVVWFIAGAAALYMLGLNFFIFAIFIVGLLAIGLVDLILNYFVIKPMLARTSWKGSVKSKRNVGWLILLACNVGIQQLSSYDRQHSGIEIETLNVAIVLAVPLWLLLTWFRGVNQFPREASPET